MTDPRYSKLARLLVNYSTALKKGDRILLDMIDVPDEFTVELIRAVRAAGERGKVGAGVCQIGEQVANGRPPAPSPTAIQTIQRAVATTSQQYRARASFR